MLAIRPFHVGNGLHFTTLKNVSFNYIFEIFLKVKRNYSYFLKIRELFYDIEFLLRRMNYVLKSLRKGKMKHDFSNINLGLKADIS